MKCEAIAVRTSRPCKNDAVGDTGACEHEAHQLQVAARRERESPSPSPAARELSDDEIAPTWDSLSNQQRVPDPAVTNQRAIANDRSAPVAARRVDPALAALLDDLPPAADQTAAEIAETISGAPIVRDMDELQRQARRVLPHAGELDDDELDPGEVEAAAAARADDADAARVQLRRDVTGGGQWQPARVEFYLRVLINPKFVKDGKEPLTDEELQEGSEVGARVLNDLFGARPENPYLAAAAWGATIVATRYFEELLAGIAGTVRRVRGRGAPAPRPAADEAPAAAAAVPASFAGRGFGAAH